MKTRMFKLRGACGIATFLCIITASQISNSELLPCPPDSVQLSVVQFTGEAADDNMGMGLDAAGDFNGDTIVNFVDFGVLSSYLQASACGDPDWCDGTDLDRDRDVDFGDVRLFADYWLEKTELSDVADCSILLAGSG